MRRYVGASIRARQKRWCLAVHCGLSPSQRHAAAIFRELWPPGRYWLAALMHRWLFFFQPMIGNDACCQTIEGLHHLLRLVWTTRWSPSDAT